MVTPDGSIREVTASVTESDGATTRLRDCTTGFGVTFFLFFVGSSKIPIEFGDGAK